MQYLIMLVAIWSPQASADRKMAEEHTICRHDEPQSMDIVISEQVMRRYAARCPINPSGRSQP
jgi:hypothetical protein